MRGNSNNPLSVLADPFCGGAKTFDIVREALRSNATVEGERGSLCVEFGFGRELDGTMTCEPEVYPGSFGRYFYGRPSPLNSESRPLTEKPGAVQSTVAACGGPLFLQLTRDARGAFVANVCEEGELQPFGSVTLVSAELVPRGRIPTTWKFNIEFLPRAHVIANSSSSSNELFLIRADIEQMAKNAKVPVLTILSQPDPIRPGTEFRYVLRCLGGNDGASFTLEYGPTGMSVSESGVVTWSVAETIDAAELGVAVKVRRGSKEMFHRFALEWVDLEVPSM